MYVTITTFTFFVNLHFFAWSQYAYNSNVKLSQILYLLNFMLSFNLHFIFLVLTTKICPSLHFVLQFWEFLSLLATAKVQFKNINCPLTVAKLQVTHGHHHVNSNVKLFGAWRTNESAKPLECLEFMKAPLASVQHTAVIDQQAWGITKEIRWT
jgi:hypothetical protein